MMIRGAVLERFVLLPFSMGCDSKSSVVLADAKTISRSSKHESKTRRKGGKEAVKTSARLSKTSLSHGLHRFMRRFKVFTQFFVYKQDLEQREEEMEIGFPTDVKHVTHIGLDGSTTTINPVPKWEINLKPNSETDHHDLLSLPSLSLHQFELAMAAQSNAIQRIHLSS